MESVRRTRGKVEEDEKMRRTRGRKLRKQDEGEQIVRRRRKKTVTPRRRGEGV